MSQVKVICDLKYLYSCNLIIEDMITSLTVIKYVYKYCTFKVLVSFGLITGIV